MKPTLSQVERRAMFIWCERALLLSQAHLQSGRSPSLHKSHTPLATFLRPANTTCLIGSETETIAIIDQEQIKNGLGTEWRDSVWKEPRFQSTCQLTLRVHKRSLRVGIRGGAPWSLTIAAGRMPSGARAEDPVPQSRSPTRREQFWPIISQPTSEKRSEMSRINRIRKSVWTSCLKTPANNGAPNNPDEIASIVARLTFLGWTCRY